ncbi:MAG: metallophosphoesterase [Lactobacillaceae bacterium]|jgi:putative phosphoesterase|nr:metallophosphoesterase [Lactobacillaceae bacterium]
MSKVAFSSDNHLDINKQDFMDIMKRQTEYLISNDYDFYFFAGDLSNDFEKTLRFFEDMAIYAGGFVAPFFIAGNHDMGKGISYSELESLEQSQYLHRQRIQIGKTTVEGNNGWYDYSFVGDDYPIEEIEHFKNGLWYDRVIQQDGVSDKERFETNLEQLRPADILVTHFLPNHHQIKRFKDQPRWDLSNAVMGSDGFGEYVIENNFKHVIYGHMHINEEFENGGVSFHNVSVGNKKELNDQGFFEVWKNKLLTLEIF